MVNKKSLATFVRTVGNQAIAGFKHFLNNVKISGTLTINAETLTTPATSVLTLDGNNVVRSATAFAGISVDATSKVKHEVKAGVAINKGQAVYVTSADGTNMIVGLASNATEATSSKTMGLMETTVAINGKANVITEGLLDGLDTSMASAGDVVWLGTGGNLIYGLANKPYAPAHLVFIGIVTRSNSNNGEIFVKVQNGFELNEIHDVDLKTTVPVNGHILGFNGTLWVNKTIAGWLGYTPANAANEANWNAAYNDKINGASVTGTTTKTLTLTQQDGGTISTSWTDINTDAVTSVFGRTGAVVAASGDYTTAQVTESGNLYYTEARVNANTNVAANTAARHNAVTLGTANGLSLSTQVLSLGLASTSTTGALSSTDWNTFNNKQNALTNPVVGTGTSTRVAFWNNSNSLSSNANLFWDNTNSRLGIGTASPAESLHVTGSGRFQGNLTTGFGAGTGDTNIEVGIGRTGNGNSFIDLIGDTTYSDYGIRLIRFNTGANAISGLYHRGTGDFVIGPVDSAALRFQTASATRLSILSNGNVGIGTTSPSSLLSVNGAISAGTVNATNSTIRGYFVDNNGVPTSNLGNPTITEMALFGGQFNNKTWFYNRTMFTFEYTNDGTNWITQSVADTEIGNFVSGNNNSGIFIPRNCQKYRILIQNDGNYVYANALYMYFSTNGNNTAVRIYKRREDETSWTIHTNSATTVSSWPGHLYLPMSTIPWSRQTTAGHYRYIQIEFTPNWISTPPYDTTNINLYGLEIWGGYPSARRDIFTWDRDRSVYFPASIYATTFVGALSGNASTAGLLQTARNINGTSFNGSANITTSTWGTSRTITIGSTGKSVDGSGNVSWTLAEIGAQAALTNPVTGTGTTNYITKWSSTNAVTNSQVFDNGTNVGVGNANPQSKLHVSGESRIDGNIVTGYGSNSEYSLTMGQSRTGNGFSYIDLIGDTTYTDYGLRMIRFNAGANAESQIVHRGTGLLSIGTIDTAPFAIKTIDSTRLYITAGGNVGIGTTSPSYMLDVSGEVRVNNNWLRTSYIRSAGAGANDLLIQADSGEVIFRTNGANERMRIDLSGNIGIGTSTPTKKLDVNGGGKFNGFLEVQNTAEPYNQFKIRDAFTPSSSGDTSGAQGNITWDDSFIYIKTSSGWKRATIDAF